MDITRVKNITIYHLEFEDHALEGASYLLSKFIKNLFIIFINKY